MKYDENIQNVKNERLWHDKMREYFEQEQPAFTEAANGKRTDSYAT